MNKVGIVLVGAVLVGTFALGRYTAPVKTVTVEAKESLKIERVEAQDKSVRLKKITIVTNAKGDKTETVEDLTQTDVQINGVLASKDKESKAVMVENRSKMTLHGLLGIGPSKDLTYGVGASYRILGPVSLGAAYLQEKPLVLMLGVDL
jgi:LEA14-like dessication related protein